MGLLTNPNANSAGGVMSLLERHHLRLAWLCYAIGVAGIFVFPESPYNLYFYPGESAVHEPILFLFADCI